MEHSADQILAILDRCADAFTFPALDNGYVYLAATRLTLYRSPQDWALAFEIFGFSPRAGLPDLHVQTFSNRLHNRNSEEGYVSRAAYENYLANNPFNESRFFFPIEEGAWQDKEDCELVSTGESEVVLRGDAYSLPSSEAYGCAGIELESASRVSVFELCRYLAHEHRSLVLANDEERVVSVPPDLELLLTLDEWSHPDVSGGKLPSGCPTFIQLARVLESGDPKAFQPSEAPNTHRSHWPEGGTL